MNRQLLKYGEPPVLYNEQLAVISAEQIRLHLNNKGYLNAEVTRPWRKKKKSQPYLRCDRNEPHRIRSFRDTIRSADTTIHNILNESKRLDIIKAGDIFDLSVLELGRERMTTTLRNRGYYNFLKDNFYFLADTTVGNNQVDVTLALNNPTDSTMHKQYNIGNVTVINGVDAILLEDSTRHNLLDTVYYRDLQIISEKDRFLLPQAVYYNTFVRPGRLYSDRIVERTYSSLNGIDAINQTAINLTTRDRNDSNFIDSRITLFPGNVHYMQFGVDGPIRRVTGRGKQLYLRTPQHTEGRRDFRCGKMLL